MIDIINWEQAYENFEHNKKEDLDEVKRLLKEIETSDFSYLDARDVHYYAGQLNTYSNRKEPYTSNEIRKINMDAQGVSSLDLLSTFVGDDTDDVIDFY